VSSFASLGSTVSTIQSAIVGSVFSASVCVAASVDLNVPHDGFVNGALSTDSETLLNSGLYINAAVQLGNGLSLYASGMANSGCSVLEAVVVHGFHRVKSKHGMTRIGDRSSGFDEGVIGNCYFWVRVPPSSKQAYTEASCRRVGLLCLTPFFLCLPLFGLQSDMSTCK
jgi:hypothetical protein